MLEFFGPIVGNILEGSLIAAIPLIGAPLSVWIFRMLQKVGIDIDAGHRASLTAAATRGAGSLVHLIFGGAITQDELASAVAGGPIPAPVLRIVQEVQAAAPDAAAHFKLGGNKPEQIATLAAKVIGIAGALMAPGLATVPGT